MSLAAAAVFAQIIPMLLIAVFLGSSSARLRRGDAAEAITALVLGVAGEGLTLYFIAKDTAVPTWAATAIGSATLLLLAGMLLLGGREIYERVRRRSEDEHRPDPKK